MQPFDFDSLICPLSTKDIERCIPHRFPFLLIDRVIELRKGDMIKAIKNVTITEPFLQGHFPGNPVMPGVLIFEALAQAGAVLGKVTSDGRYESCLLTEISESRFRRVVSPGDTLVLLVKIARTRGPFYWFEAEALVENEAVATGKFSAKLT